MPDSISGFVLDKSGIGSALKIRGFSGFGRSVGLRLSIL